MSLKRKPVATQSEACLRGRRDAHSKRLIAEWIKQEEKLLHSKHASLRSSLKAVYKIRERLTRQRTGLKSMRHPLATLYFYCMGDELTRMNTAKDPLAKKVFELRAKGIQEIIKRGWHKK